VEFEALAIEGAYVVHHVAQRDERGSFARTWCADEFAAAGIDFVPVQGNLSRTDAVATLRGLHFQRPPDEETKLVQCLRGGVFDAIVDLRRASPTFGRSAAVVLEEGDGRSLFVPAGCAHGFLTTRPDTELHYVMGARHVPASARGVRWDDPALGIEWPDAPRVISERDAALPLLTDLDPEDLS
jgi:dTDP-4-dehydrorhamnose 3,5-epimerase